MKNQVLESHIKKTTITSNAVSVLIALITAVTICYGFYFNTNATLNNHTQSIKEVKEDVGIIKEKISNSKSFEGVTQAQQNDMKARIQRIEDKQDQMIELILSLNKNYKIESK